MGRKTRSSISHDREKTKMICAQLHYLEDLSQDLIATRLGINKASVSRCLKDVRQEQRVRIKLDFPADKDIQQRLINRFALRDAVVDPFRVSLSRPDPTLLKCILGRRAAYYLEHGSETPFRDGMKLALSCGETLMQTFLALTPDRFEGLDILTLTVESVPQLAYQSPSTLAGVLYARYSRESKVFAPQLTRLASSSHSDEYLRLVGDLEQEIRKNSKGLDLALVGIGTVDFRRPRSPFFELIRNIDLQPKFLEDEKAVGEINNRPYNEKGEDIFLRTSKETPHLIALELSFLKKMVADGKPVVAVAGGEKKVKAIRVALEQGFVNYLVTDYDTAEGILKTPE